MNDVLFSQVWGQGYQALARIDDMDTVAHRVLLQEQEVPAGSVAPVAVVDMLRVAAAVVQVENADFAGPVGLADSFLVVLVAQIDLAASVVDLYPGDNNRVCARLVGVHL